MAKKVQKNANAQGANIQVGEANQVQNVNMISKVWDGVQYKHRTCTSYDEMVQVENSMVNTYKLNADKVKDAITLYRKSLKGTLDTLRDLYHDCGVGAMFGVDIDVHKHLDVLAKLAEIDVNKLFDVKFVSSLFDTYTFQLLDGSGVQTLKAVKSRKTDKTDYSRILNSAENVGYYVDIAASEHVVKDKVYYWKPILNFTPNLVLKTVFAVNKDSVFKIQREALKAAQRAATRKAKKQGKKNETTNVEAANVEAK